MPKRKSEDWDLEDPIVELWRCWCPCPENITKGEGSLYGMCSKGNAQLWKGRSEGGAVDAIMSHLMNSPYHKLSEAEAKGIIAGNPDCIQKLEENPDPSQSSGSAVGHPVPPSTPSEVPTVTLRLAELTAIRDSISRAARVALAAANLAESAAQAFRAEASALEAAHAALDRPH